MAERMNIMFPVGRLVSGSLYEPQTTDMEGRPLEKPYYHFGVALKKGEADFKQTPWGQSMLQVAQSSWPQGQWQMPAFSWKVEDGDSTVPNAKGVLPSSKEGYPGHWIVHFRSNDAPTVVTGDGQNVIPQRDVVKRGYYIQVYGSVKGNDTASKPGIYVNHNIVAFSAEGPVIITGPDPKTLGFGGSLPQGATGVTHPAAQSAPPAGAFGAPPPVVTPPPPVTPHYGFLNPGAPPPPPAAPVRTMTAKAGGASYEAFKAQGWSDDQLIAQGYMT